MNFRGTLEMSLINCEIKLMLAWSVNCVITNSTSAEIFTTTDTIFVFTLNIYISVVTLSTQDSMKLLEQLKSGIKPMISY